MQKKFGDNDQKGINIFWIGRLSKGIRIAITVHAVQRVVRYLFLIFPNLYRVMVDIITVSFNSNF